MSFIDDISGVTTSIRNRLAALIPTGRAVPISTQTGAGTELIYREPTVAPPPNAASAVMQQTDTSVQLQENTVTGSGTGAGRSSSPITFSIITQNSILVLAGLVIVLILAYAVDKGKL